MYEYIRKHQTIVHSRFICKSYVLDVLRGLVKDKDKLKLRRVDEDVLMECVAYELRLYEDAPDFDANERMTKAVREWALDEGIEVIEEA